MKITLLQWNTIWENPEENFDRVQSLMDEMMDDSDPDLVCLPEMFATGFSMNVTELAEEQEGPTHQFLEQLAKSYEVYLQGTAMESDGEAGENVVLLFDPDGNLICRYAKIHPFSYLEEDRYYRPGKTVETVEVEGFTVCPVICFDLRFPEIFRKGVARGADLFLVPSNWPSARLDHWNVLLRARAIENQAYVAAPNRTGEGDGIKYPGHSLVLDPWGKTVSKMDREEGWTTARISPDTVKEIRDEYPFLKDMNPKFVGEDPGFIDSL